MLPCMLNGDQCFYKGIEKKKKYLLRNLECGFDFEIWFLTRGPWYILLLKQTGLMNTDLL